MCGATVIAAVSLLRIALATNRHDRANKRDDPSMLQFILGEYSSLRDEILRRADHRITLLVTSLTISSAVIGIAVEREGADLLLVVPVIAVLFGLLVLFHHVIIYSIADYIRENIEAPLKEAFPDLKGWQSTRAPAPAHARGALSIWHFPMMAATLVPTLIALGLSLTFPGRLTTRVMLLIVDVAALSYYLVQYIGYMLRGFTTQSKWPSN